MPAAVKASTTALPDSDDEPEWDTTPLGFNMWWTELSDYLENIDSDYVTMWQYGYCMEKRTCVTPTLFHAMAIRDRIVRKHSFEDPIDSDIQTERALPKSATPLTATDKERVTSAPEYFDRKARNLCRDIVRTIKVKKVRKAWKQKAGGNGLRLLELLRDHASSLGPTANNAISAKLQRAVERVPEVKQNGKVALLT